MANITAFIGRDFGIGEHSSRHVANVTMSHLIENGIDGATFTDCVGVWRGDVENSIRVDVIGCDACAAHVALQSACVELMQWSILYVVDGVYNVFIENDPSDDRAAFVEGIVSQAV